MQGPCPVNPTICSARPIDEDGETSSESESSDDEEELSSNAELMLRTIQRQNQATGGLGQLSL